MSHIRHVSLIHKFDFQHWERVPSLLSNTDKKSLTREEQHILSAIKFAYYTHEAGRKVIYKKVARTGTLFVISLICLVGLISLIAFGSNNAKGSINAATVSAALKQNFDEVIESTMSAIFK